MIAKINLAIIILLFLGGVFVWILFGFMISKSGIKSFGISLFLDLVKNRFMSSNPINTIIDIPIRNK
jgi:hypothetical protein